MLFVNEQCQDTLARRSMTCSQEGLGREAAPVREAAKAAFAAALQARAAEMAAGPPEMFCALEGPPAKAAAALAFPCAALAAKAAAVLLPLTMLATAAAAHHNPPVNFHQRIKP